ncbi:hypothetical protein NP233_g9422 [Leucocoprinus birnbaumii]|uniref:Uncharacterized protein n=1 Tax=Leucocoprinus birnbaumii TaxID=56174 RepID=A0AAD5VKM1_9AGAR|nr:hypothetical protein NP233_g9422 [Leucocoprinus birnbaumii]
MANSTLPNPDIYLNHLTPDLAGQFEVTRDVYLTLLGAAIWDVLVYLPDDIRIALSSPFSFTILCFLTTRLFAIAETLIMVVTQTHPIDNCRAMPITMSILCILSMSTTSFLFLRRLHAVFFDQRPIRWLFGFLWLGANGVTVLGPIGLNAMHIEGTNYCTFYQVHSYSSMAEFVPAAFDTLVFLAISYQLITSYTEVGVSDSASWRAFFTGNLSPIARALLRGCQQYYLMVCWMTIASGILLYLPSVPPLYRPMLGLANNKLTASMACRVFRNLKNLDLRSQSSESGWTTEVSNLRFAPEPSQGSMRPQQQSSLPVIDIRQTAGSVVVLPVGAEEAAGHWQK